MKYQDNSAIPNYGFIHFEYATNCSDYKLWKFFTQEHQTDGLDSHSETFFHHLQEEDEC